MATFISAALSGLSLLQDEMQVQGLAVGVGPHAGEAALDQDLLKWERPILSSFFFFLSLYVLMCSHWCHLCLLPAGYFL